ncbi:ankyrin [Periconia macrospinosa]|uniref:Ankyrin n=1 Tax=Periconia macrospinosa TaxID=97972 RepID=A0A2V1DFY5_9PLEO|nr:ankyrin [Periconia macrospinosa]
MRDLPVVQLVVSANADIHAVPERGVIRTPLQAAVETGAWDIINFLLGRGVDVNAPPAINNGRTALQIAAEKGFIGIASLLISKKADVNAPPGQFHGRTAFEAAAEHGRIEMLIYLVENGADIVSDGGRQYKNALRFAKMNGHTGVDIYVKDVYRTQCFLRSGMNTTPLENGQSSESYEFDPRLFL